ncbi:transglutaminase-like cysteine peptidase [uncultured Bradyrhizobium sp.]|uniref:transglutaminase-like cysteine peptidase n=1 Tax=uncultured Bradyrhizobium sp. TaxID=199684 RepID=UPI002629EDB8|nr:transglutaminase-like cysteine peptidase [uncultured Bradyrhizobium sp.]
MLARLLVILLTSTVITMGATTHLAAATLLSPGSAERLRQHVEPFGRQVSRLSSGELFEKWRVIQRNLEADQAELMRCARDVERCASEPALRFLAIIEQAKAREGRARFGEVNRAVNLAIYPISDLKQYGAVDVWTSPLTTLSTGKGDCEDYAIAKYAALRQSGVPADDLRIVILRDLLRDEEHAVVSARLDGHWLILDNRHMSLVEDQYIRNYEPLFVLDQNGVMYYHDARFIQTKWE